jgi:hypothetical protein
VERNLLLAPCNIGDPFTAFDVENVHPLHNNPSINNRPTYLCTGTASGQILQWKINEIPPNRKESPVFTCRILSPASDEGIRHIIINSLNHSLSVVVGDAHVKFWKNLLDPKAGGNPSSSPNNSPNPTNAAFKMIRLDRQHTYSSCSNSFTLKADNSDIVPNNFLNKSSSSVLILFPSDNLQHQINVAFTQKLSETKDLNSLLSSAQIQQYSVPFRFPPNSVPLYFDAESYRLLTLQTALDTGIKSVYLHNWPQLNPAALNLNAHELINQQPTKLQPILQFSNVHKYYSGFQLQENQLAHICCQNKIKVWQILTNPAENNAENAQNPGNSNGSNNNNNNHHGSKLNNSCKLLYKLEVHKGRVINFLLCNSGRTVISMGEDKKIKVHFEGKLQCKIKGITGNFHLNYPYLLRVNVSTRMLYYTADEGLFCLQLPQHIKLQ